MSILYQRLFFKVGTTKVRYFRLRMQITRFLSLQPAVYTEQTRKRKSKELDLWCIVQPSIGVLANFLLLQIYHRQHLPSDQRVNHLRFSWHAEANDSVGKSIPLDESSIGPHVEDRPCFRELEICELSWCYLPAKDYIGHVIAYWYLANSHKCWELELNFAFEYCLHYNFMKVEIKIR